jgi:hypothetical protein
MLYRVIVNLGFLALGYYLGREVGRTEAVREQLLRARRSGETLNMRDAVIIDMEKDLSNTAGKQGPVKH